MVDQSEDRSIDAYLPERGGVTVLTEVLDDGCTNLKRILAHEGIPFREVVIDEDPEAEEVVAELLDGRPTPPTVLFSDGSVLGTPSVQDIKEALARLRF